MLLHKNNMTNMYLPRSCYKTLTRILIMKESSDMEEKGMRRDNPPLSATSVYPSESEKYKGKDEVGSYICVRNKVAGKQ